MNSVGKEILFYMVSSNIKFPKSISRNGGLIYVYIRNILNFRVDKKEKILPCYFTRIYQPIFLSLFVCMIFGQLVLSTIYKVEKEQNSIYQYQKYFLSKMQLHYSTEEMIRDEAHPLE